MNFATQSFQLLVYNALLSKREDVMTKKPQSKTKKLATEVVIRSRADYSLAVLGMAFVRNGSGRFLNIRARGDRLMKKAA